MAKSPTKKRFAHSTAKPGGRGFDAPERIVLLKLKPKRAKGLMGDGLTPSAPDCACLNAILQGLPSGTMLVVEDDALVGVPPPNYLGVWTFDPNRNGGLPFWDRVQAP
jgi:hypothetical protein